jgi:hypothetical protein
MVNRRGQFGVAADERCRGCRKGSRYRLARGRRQLGSHMASMPPTSPQPLIFAFPHPTGPRQYAQRVYPKSRHATRSSSAIPIGILIAIAQRITPRRRPSNRARAATAAVNKCCFRRAALRQDEGTESIRSELQRRKTSYGAYVHGLLWNESATAHRAGRCSR